MIIKGVLFVALSFLALQALAVAARSAATLVAGERGEPADRPRT